VLSESFRNHLKQKQKRLFGSHFSQNTQEHSRKRNSSQQQENRRDCSLSRVSNVTFGVCSSLAKLPAPWKLKISLPQALNISLP
jgi:hypothetical protein